VVQGTMETCLAHLQDAGANGILEGSRARVLECRLRWISTLGGDLIATAPVAFRTNWKKDLSSLAT
jgi:hypothetical protein